MTNFILSSIAGASVLVVQWLYGNKSIWGPVFGLVSAIPWVALILYTESYGLFPSTAIMTAIHVRNLRRWLYQP